MAAPAAMVGEIENSLQAGAEPAEQPPRSLAEPSVTTADVGPASEASGACMRSRGDRCAEEDTSSCGVHRPIRRPEAADAADLSTAHTELRDAGAALDGAQAIELHPSSGPSAL